MRPLNLILAKRNGSSLTDEQIGWFIGTYASGDDIADEQVAALAMAIYFQGMEPRELSRWTAAMIDSGERLDLSELERPTVDKHSTGGVGDKIGDKISLILVPLVAACEAAVPQLSGRGLGHTGGTLDKLEAISGWSPEMTTAHMLDQLDSIGAAIAGASADLAPADRKLYALRDVTGTVDSIPLISSSIMSKKIAEGTDSLVLDVKFGSGAFIKDRETALELARTMVGIGNDHGVATSALVTGMEDVLGATAGNALEVREALDVLGGGGPPDVVELTLALANEMLRHAGLDVDPAVTLQSGAALEVFERMVEAQGGDLSAGLPEAQHRSVLTAPSAGYIAGFDALKVGEAAWSLGAGRARKEDSVSQTAGVVCLVAPGEAVEQGQPVLELHADDPSRFEQARETLAGAARLTAEPEPHRSRVEAMVGAGSNGGQPDGEAQSARTT